MNVQKKIVCVLWKCFGFLYFWFGNASAFCIFGLEMHRNLRVFGLEMYRKNGYFGLEMLISC